VRLFRPLWLHSRGWRVLFNGLRFLNEVKFLTIVATSTSSTTIIFDSIHWRLTNTWVSLALSIFLIIQRASLRLASRVRPLLSRQSIYRTASLAYKAYMKSPSRIIFSLVIRLLLKSNFLTYTSFLSTLPTWLRRFWPKKLWCKMNSVRPPALLMADSSGASVSPFSCFYLIYCWPDLEDTPLRLDAQAIEPLSSP